MYGKNKGTYTKHTKVTQVKYLSKFNNYDSKTTFIDLALLSLLFTLNKCLVIGKNKDPNKNS